MKTSTRPVKDSLRWMRLVSGQHPVPIAQSPREEVFRRDQMVLYRYQRETPATHPVPVLMVYSLINRPAILDLSPGRSVVQHLLSRGFEVYLIDWGVPTVLDQQLDLDAYLNVFLRMMVRETCRHAGTPQVTLFGYCMGGTMAAMYAALHPRRVNSLLLLGAPFHFRSEELLYRWGCDAQFFDPARLVEACGNAPPWAFDGFTLLKLDQKAPRMISLYDNIQDSTYVENHLAMEQWINDNIPMAGAVYREFLLACFHDNLLIHGRLHVGGRRVDLSSIECPALIVTGGADHLVPPETSEPVAEVLPDAEVVRFPSGHIGLSVSGAAHRKLWPAACDWLTRVQPIRNEQPVG